MQLFYILCFIAAFSLFLWQSVSDARQSVVQQTMLLVIIISNGGYAALAGAENLREAVLATKVLYTGACSLPMLYFITMCEVCRVHLSRFLLAGMTLLQTLLFGFVCTIGHNDLFYKAIEFHRERGISYLTKEYGPFHLMYPLTMYLYYLLTLVLAVYTIRHKKSVNRHGITLMMLSFLFAIAGYVVERALHWKAEVMPLLYVVLIGVSLLQTYQSNLFTIEENKSIIHEQLEKVGFIAFGLQGQYMGCNACAEQLFPEMREYTVGQTPRTISERFQKNVVCVVEQFAQTHSRRSHEHEHEKVHTLTLDGRQYRKRASANRCGSPF